MNISLSQFARDIGLAKATVFRKCQELEIVSTNGLTPEDCDRLRSEFGIANQPAEPPAIRPEMMLEGFIQPGKLATIESREIQLPKGFDPAAMVKFFDGVTGQATDTKSLVAIADLALSAVETAMDTKLEEQRRHLTQAEKDARDLQSKISEAKTTLKVKALESKLLADRQTEATKTAEQLFAELMALGKPAPDSPSTG